MRSQLGTPVLDVLCRNMDTLMAAKNTMAIESQILTALNNRGISKVSHTILLMYVYLTCD